MKIVVTTPTGHIGRGVVENLLEAGNKPTLIARDPDKVKDFVKRGATVVKGSHDDAAVVTEATKGADAFFLLTPPDYTVTDIRAHYRRFGEAAAKAIEANGISRVVHLSSVGADLESGTGPVVGLYENEQILAKVAKNLVNLRPGYFMENTMGQLQSIAQAGSLFTTFAGDTSFPMIATRDIAARAAQLLTDRTWTGRRVVELQGAGETSYAEVAGVLAEVLGRPIQHVTVTPEQQRDALIGMGFSDVLAASFHELSSAIGEGRVKFHEPRSKKNTTPTTYPVFAKEVFKRAFEASS